MGGFYENGKLPFVLSWERNDTMKKWEVQDSVKSAFLNPAAAFALGAFCGLAIGMLCMPFSKGIVIGSHNGSNNKESHEEGDYITDAEASE